MTPKLCLTTRLSNVHSIESDVLEAWHDVLLKDAHMVCKLRNIVFMHLMSLNRTMPRRVHRNTNCQMLFLGENPCMICFIPSWYNPSGGKSNGDEGPPCSQTSALSFGLCQDYRYLCPSLTLNSLCSCTSPIVTHHMIAIPPDFGGAKSLILKTKI